jgi:antitoxin (DNA-binding transcriptional repressor) of toxin-antitoxin stability system
MTVVTVHQAKTNLSRLIESVSQGEDVIIARGPKAVAPIVPIGKVKRKRQPWIAEGQAPHWLGILRASNRERTELAAYC